ncbi:hypothetical protein, partial [Paenibacillus anaericanus]|uniref:hypothetical protein n=1 Tax=Paenibacillus anaericanus TaxID=170367 RepID=UPI001B86DDBB
VKFTHSLFSFQRSSHSFLSALCFSGDFYNISYAVFFSQAFFQGVYFVAFIFAGLSKKRFIM